jgi:Ca2+-binding EF-hand superfamily protein
LDCRAALRDAGFRDAAEAFCFFDSDDTGLITHTQLLVGQVSH